MDARASNPQKGSCPKPSLPFPPPPNWEGVWEVPSSARRRRAGFDDRLGEQFVPWEDRGQPGPDCCHTAGQRSFLSPQDRTPAWNLDGIRQVASGSRAARLLPDAAAQEEGRAFLAPEPPASSRSKSQEQPPPESPPDRQGEQAWPRQEGPRASCVR